MCFAQKNLKLPSGLTKLCNFVNKDYYYYYYFQAAFNRYLENAAVPPKHDPVQGLIHSAYISIALNNYKDAIQILQQAHKLNPANALVSC